MQSRVSVVGKRWGILVCLSACALLALRAAPAGPDAPFRAFGPRLSSTPARSSPSIATTTSFEAVAIRDGKILAVGTDREVLRLQGPGTQVIDLHGRTVIPGYYRQPFPSHVRRFEDFSAGSLQSRHTRRDHSNDGRESS